VVNGVVYVGSHDQNLYAIDAMTGLKHWSFETGGLVVSSPVVVEDVVYFGSFDGNYYAVDAASGKELGRLTTGSILESFSVLAGDQIVFGARDGTVYGIDRVPSASEGAQFSTVIGTPAATPVAVMTPNSVLARSDEHDGTAATPAVARAELAAPSAAESCQPNWHSDKS
jgi:outer membrane protein assembly factor BamB